MKILKRVARQLPWKGLKRAVLFTIVVVVDVCSWFVAASAGKNRPTKDGPCKPLRQTSRIRRTRELARSYENIVQKAVKYAKIR